MLGTGTRTIFLSSSMAPRLQLLAHIRINGGQFIASTSTRGRFCRRATRTRGGVGRRSCGGMLGLTGVIRGQFIEPRLDHLGNFVLQIVSDRVAVLIRL